MIQAREWLSFGLHLLFQICNEIWRNCSLFVESRQIVQKVKPESVGLVMWVVCCHLWSHAAATVWITASVLMYLWFKVMKGWLTPPLRMGCDHWQGSLSPQALLLEYLPVALQGSKWGLKSHRQVTAQCTVHLLKVAESATFSLWHTASLCWLNSEFNGSCAQGQDWVTNLQFKWPEKHAECRFVTKFDLVHT